MPGPLTNCAQLITDDVDVGRTWGRGLARGEGGGEAGSGRPDLTVAAASQLTPAPTHTRSTRRGLHTPHLQSLSFISPLSTCFSKSAG